MITIPFLYVQIIALCCYSFLLFSMLISKKNKLLYSFISLLIAFIGWTGGSLLMRLLVYPGYRLWYEISLSSIYLVPVLMYDFVCAYTGQNNKKIKATFWIGTIITIILTHFEVFLKVPKLVDIGVGQKAFVYNTTWHILISTIFFAIIAFYACYLVVLSIKKNNYLSPGLKIVAVGIFILFAGNLSSVIPGNVFPIDILSGIIYAFALLLSLYIRRLFNIQLLLSSNVIAFFGALISAFVFFYFLKDIDNYIINNIPAFSQNHLLITNLLFLQLVLTTYFFIKSINKRIYRTRNNKEENIKGYSSKISKSLKVDEISSELISVIKSSINIEKIYICLWDEKNKQYKTVSVCSPLSSKDFIIREDNPCIKALLKNKQDEFESGCLLLSDFSKTVHYKSMWEFEKNEFEKIGAVCLAPLKVDDNLYGIIVLAGKSNKILTNEEMSFIESISSITSIAIKNALLYEKAFNDAQTDELTGLINRKFFHKYLDELVEKSKNDVLSLLFLNIDDFKLYNQLYGYYEGDKALKEIAKIIKTNVGQYGKVARYSGKVFAVILPGLDSSKTLFFAEKIANNLSLLASSKLNKLTLSGGIASYPMNASSANQLLQNVELAVYNAKFSGKNKIVTYASGKVYEKQINNSTSRINDKYSEYASTIHALTAAIDVKDHVTFGHSQRVSEYATALGREVGLEDEHIKIIKEAALLHDIGKIGVPEKILSKKGKLDDDEYFEMKKHVENSIEIIKHLPALDYLIPVAISHHERWDGRGYPRGIKGEDIPIGGRCLAIADAFDAMTSERQYKKSLSVEFALNEIKKNAGTQFDPELAVAFVNMIKNRKILSDDILKVVNLK